MALSTVQEIERALSELAPQELNEIYLWLNQRYSELVEDRFRSDLDAGRLDAAIQRALEDDEAGRTHSL
jgi:hypothetical protein